MRTANAGCPGAVARKLARLRPVNQAFRDAADNVQQKNRQCSAQPQNGGSPMPSARPRGDWANYKSALTTHVQGRKGSHTSAQKSWRVLLPWSIAWTW